MLERVCAKWWSPQGQGKSLNSMSSAEDLFSAGPLHCWGLTGLTFAK